MEEEGAGDPRGAVSLFVGGGDGWPQRSVVPLHVPHQLRGRAGPGRAVGLDDPGGRRHVGHLRFRQH